MGESHRVSHMRHVLCLCHIHDNHSSSGMSVYPEIFLADFYLVFWIKFLFTNVEPAMDIPMAISIHWLNVA